MQKNNIVVYTAISGGYDDLKLQPQGDWKYIAYVEDPKRGKDWEQRQIEQYDLDPNRRAKYYKLHPNELFKAYEYSVWIDGSVEVVGDIKELVKTALKDHDWAVYRHYERDCIFDEAFTCALLKRDDPDLMSRQVSRYMVGEGYPRHNGLAENTIIIRRHTPKTKELCDMWWKEIKRWSKRDQLSFNYCAWKLGIEYKELEGNVYNNKYFKVNKHAG